MRRNSSTSGREPFAIPFSEPALSFFLINSWYLDEIEDTIEDEDLGWKEFFEKKKLKIEIGLSEFAKEELGLTISEKLDDYLLRCIPPDGDDPDSYSALEQFTSVYCLMLGEDKRRQWHRTWQRNWAARWAGSRRWTPREEQVSQYGSATSIIETLKENPTWKENLVKNERFQGH